MSFTPAISRDSDVTTGERGAAMPVVTSILENGMAVVVIPDRRSPIVTHMVWYRNGAADDPPGKSGIAHFLEHLMFKGTETYPAGHFGKLLAAVGGQENAFTSYDYTAYFQRVPKLYLETCMGYEADRMRNLVLTDAVIGPERDVVLAERGMRSDSEPARLLDEAVQAAAFPAHPSGRPVIGWRHEIEGLGREDALAYYRRFYTPANAILIVAGDVDHATVHAMAVATYGSVAGDGPLPERRRLQDPPRRTRKILSLSDAKVRQPRLQRLHVVPSARTAGPGEAEALEVLAFLLGGDATSILHTRLVVERRCATSVSVAYWDVAVDEGRLFIQGTPAADVTPEALDAAVDDVLQTLRETGFTAGDIERAKTQIVADAHYRHDSQSSRAEWYGASLACGLTIPDLAAWPQHIDAVTPEALHAALERLDGRTAVVGYLLEAAAAA